MIPANQRLESNETVRFYIPFRLVDDKELVIFQSKLQIFFQLHFTDQLYAHFLIVQAILVLP
ncbi:hypothetical protein D3C77_648550 [compost metagenome]